MTGWIAGSDAKIKWFIAVEYRNATDTIQQFWWCSMATASDRELDLSENCSQCRSATNFDHHRLTCCFQYWQDAGTASFTSLCRVGPDSPFALLFPVLGSAIPFEKGFLENPFSPFSPFSPSSLFWCYIALLLSHLSVLCMFFVRFLSKSHWQLLFGDIFGATRQFSHHWILSSTSTYC